MAQSAFFWNMLAKRYSKQPIADEAAYQKKLKKTQEYFQPDMEVLEFGCGTGSTAIIHSPFVKNILATDISPKMLAIAKEKTKAKNITNIKFKCTTIEDLALPDESMDIVMGHSILHLVKDKQAVISKVHKILKPGGLFVSSTICLGNSMKLMLFILSAGNFFGLLPLVKGFSSKELKDCITKAGFEIDYQWQSEKDPVLFVVAKKK